jgi:hypothetical protein
MQVDCIGQLVAQVLCMHTYYAYAIPVCSKRVIGDGGSLAQRTVAERRGQLKLDVRPFDIRVVCCGYSEHHDPKIGRVESEKLPTAATCTCIAERRLPPLLRYCI